MNLFRRTSKPTPEPKPAIYLDVYMREGSTWNLSFSTEDERSSTLARIHQAMEDGTGLLIVEPDLTLLVSDIQAVKIRDYHHTYYF